MKNNFLREMQERGYLNQCTDLGKLGEIWSILAQRAVDDNCEYLYQMGDDIEFKDSKWEDQFINKLKEEGKIPKMIILCDSSRVNFSLIDSCVGSGDFLGNKGYTMTNEFLPKRYAFWLRNTLIEQIKLLFNEEYEIL